MPRRDSMFDHFSRIASRYWSVRTTDDAPVRFVREALADRPAIRAADIGCGDGRYDRLLLRHLPNLHLVCVDINPEMLAELSRHLARDGFRNFETRVSSAERLDLDDGSLDAVLTFNAVHHFDFPEFLAKAGRALREDGRIFIYTRTPEQNARSVWGRFFPGFSAKETRLFELADMERWIREAKGLQITAAKTFRYARSASLRRLLPQARSRHYSTFSLYGEEAFARACTVFEANVRGHFEGARTVKWFDENVMLQIARTP